MAKWSRRRVRAPGSAAASWLEVTPSVRAGRLGRARSCAAGAVAAIIVAFIWGTATAPAVHEDFDSYSVDVTSRHLAATFLNFGFWTFIAGALGWHFLVERRRRPSAASRLALDGWLAIGMCYAGTLLMSIVRPFAVVSGVDPATRSFSDVPLAAAGNAVIALALTGALAVLGVFAVTRLAERRDRAHLDRHAPDRETP